MKPIFHQPPSVFSAVQKLRILFTRKQKTVWGGIVFFALGTSVLEVLTTGLVVLFAQLLSQPLVVEKYLKSCWFLPEFLLQTSSNRLVFYMSLVVGVIYVIKNILGIGEVFYQNFSIQKMHILFKKKLLQRYAENDYSFYLTRNTASSMQVINGDTETMFSLGVVSLAGMLSETIVFLGMLTFIIVIKPLLTIGVFFIGVIGGGILFKKLLPKFYYWNKHIQQSSIYNIQNLLQFFQGFKEIILLNKQEFFVNNYQEHAQKRAHLQALQTVGLYLPRMLIEILFIGIFVIAIAFLCVEHQRPEQMLGILGGYLYAGFRLMPGLNRIINHLNILKSSLPSIEKVFEELNRIQIKKQCLDIPEFTFNTALRLREVNFSYINASRQSLSQISLTIKKGEHIGIVGKTGSGKSTLLDIILGLLHPQSGSIDIDQGYSPASYQWHQKIGYVPQSIYLLDDTIENNIAFGDPLIDQEKMNKAVEIAQLQNFIDQLPNKLKTQVGERGISLSGGERQRIAIARALYRTPEVLIFDEATSALDNETEECLMGTIEKIIQQRTVIMVAHRLTTLRNCDRIVVMEQGKIVRIASYEDLMKYH